MVCSCNRIETLTVAPEIERLSCALCATVAHRSGGYFVRGATVKIEPDGKVNPNQLTEKDLIYIAGLYDGEGCFSSWWGQPGRKKQSLCRIHYGAALVMTERQAVQWAWQITGIGNLYYYEGKRQGKCGLNKGRYEWNCHGRFGAQLARLIIPFLKVKQQQARLLVELSELRAKSYQGKPFDAPRQDAIVQQMRVLNGGKGRSRRKVQLQRGSVWTPDPTHQLNHRRQLGEGYGERLDALKTS